MGAIILQLIVFGGYFIMCYLDHRQEARQARYYEQKMTEAYVKGDTEMGDTYNGIVSRMKTRNRFL